jgi:competence protein ComEA
MFKIIMGIVTISSLIFGFELSTATKEEFMQLKGVGSVVAGRIVEYRMTHGLRSIDELRNVKGIGSKKLENIKAQVAGFQNLGTPTSELNTPSNSDNYPIDLSKYDEQ